MSFQLSWLFVLGLLTANWSISLFFFEVFVLCFWACSTLVSVLSFQSPFLITVNNNSLKERIFQLHFSLFLHFIAGILINCWSLVTDPHLWVISSSVSQIFSWITLFWLKFGKLLEISDIFVFCSFVPLHLRQIDTSRMDWI